MKFEVLSPEEIAELTSRGTNADGGVNLEPYKEFITQVVDSGELWGRLILDEADKARTEKRRVTTSAKALGFLARYHPKSDSKVLIFRLLNADEAPTRRKKDTEEGTEDNKVTRIGDKKKTKKAV